MKKRKFEDMSLSNQVFCIFNIVFWVIVMFIVIYPLYLVCIASISDPDAVTRGEVIWKPVGFSLRGYQYVFGFSRIWISYANSIFYVVMGVILAIAITMLGAYVMSCPLFTGKTMFNWYMVITMFISGGLIPTFLTVRDLGLYNTRTIMIILGSFSIWNMMVARVYIQTNIPRELHEAAVLDGSSHFQYFFRVVLPLSKTIMAVLVVYYGVGKWNDYFSGLVYLKDDNLLPLQTVLKDILASTQFNAIEISAFEDIEAAQETRKLANIAKYCVIVVSTAPAVMLYSSMQKYFEKGVMIGSLKG